MNLSPARENPIFQIYGLVVGSPVFLIDLPLIFINAGDFSHAAPSRFPPLLSCSVGYLIQSVLAKCDKIILKDDLK